MLLNCCLLMLISREIIFQ